MSTSLEGMAGAAFDPRNAIESQPVRITSANYLDPTLSLVAPEPDYFAVSVVRLATCCVVALEGELDIAGVSLLERRLAEIEGEDPALTVVDLSRLQFLDCTGLRSIVAAHQRMAEAGRRVLLVPGPAHIQRLLNLTHTSSLFEYVEAHRLP